jgi:hypothetical protein
MHARCVKSERIHLFAPNHNGIPLEVPSFRYVISFVQIAQIVIPGERRCVSIGAREGDPGAGDDTDCAEVQRCLSRSSRVSAATGSPSLERMLYACVLAGDDTLGNVRGQSPPQPDPCDHGVDAQRHGHRRCGARDWRRKPGRTRAPS